MQEKSPSLLINLKDRVSAEARTLGSAVASVFPKLNFIGKADTPSYTPVRWHHLRDDSYNKGAWVHYEGISSSGYTPRNYGAAALILVDREQMDREWAYHTPGEKRHAVAYRLGSRVMLGASSKHKILGLENENDEDYKVAMRVGKGPLDAQVGIELVAPNVGLMITANIYLPLKHGVREGPVIPIKEVPERIPLL